MWRRLGGRGPGPDQFGIEESTTAMISQFRAALAPGPSQPGAVRTWAWNMVYGGHVLFAVDEDNATSQCND
jgi:hypothetical protein